MKINNLLLYLILFLCSCSNDSRNRSSSENSVKPIDLENHSKEFEKQIIKVAEGIHVAIGYGLANSIMLESENGVVIIDVMESIQSAEPVKAAFDKINSLPTKALIYTHNHTDHIFGASVFADDDNPDIYAHDLLPVYLDRLASVTRDIIEKRSYRMFGTFLEGAEHMNCGIGGHLNIDENSQLGVLRPTITFSDSLNISVAGFDLELKHAPGETPDQLLVWMPEKRILFCGDNFYKSFPNLYTIRGTAYRDVNVWKKSLDKMRYLNPEILVPSHGKPIFGAEEIQQALTAYRDAIQYLHDQTVRWMNKGLTPDELVEKVMLPQHLAESPYLQEFYGRVDWTVRSIFDGYLGHFDGNPSTLLPLNQIERAQRIEVLSGGKSNLLNSLKEAADSKDFQWVLELSDFILDLYPDDANVLESRIIALRGLGEMQANPNARHYYFTQAKELEGLAFKNLVTPSIDMVHSLPLELIFSGMASRLIPEKCMDKNKKVQFNFGDTEEVWTVWVRNGVAEIQPNPLGDADIHINTKSTVWKEIAAEVKSPLKAFTNGEIEIDGGRLSLIQFFSWFEL